MRAAAQARPQAGGPERGPPRGRQGRGRRERGRRGRGRRGQGSLAGLEAGSQPGSWPTAVVAGVRHPHLCVAALLPLTPGRGGWMVGSAVSAEWLWRSLLHRRGPEHPHLPTGSGPCQVPWPEKRTHVPAGVPAKSICTSQEPAARAACPRGSPGGASSCQDRDGTEGGSWRRSSGQAADSPAWGPPGPGSGFPTSEGDAQARSLQKELRRARGGARCGGHHLAQSCRHCPLHPQEGLSPARARGPPRPTRGFRGGTGAP